MWLLDTRTGASQTSSADNPAPAFFPVPRALYVWLPLLQHSELKVVLCVLYWQSFQEDGWCWKSLTNIAKECGFDRSTAVRAVVRLEKLKLLITKPQGKGRSIHRKIVLKGSDYKQTRRTGASSGRRMGAPGVGAPMRHRMKQRNETSRNDQFSAEGDGSDVPSEIDGPESLTIDEERSRREALEASDPLRLKAAISFARKKSA